MYIYYYCYYYIYITIVIIIIIVIIIVIIIIHYFTLLLVVVSLYIIIIIHYYYSSYYYCYYIYMCVCVYRYSNIKPRTFLHVFFWKTCFWEVFDGLCVIAPPLVSQGFHKGQAWLGPPLRLS